MKFALKILLDVVERLEPFGFVVDSLNQCIYDDYLSLLKGSRLLLLAAILAPSIGTERAGSAKQVVDAADVVFVADDNMDGKWCTAQCESIGSGEHCRSQNVMELTLTEVNHEPFESNVYKITMVHSMFRRLFLNVGVLGDGFLGVEHKRSLSKRIT